MNRILSLVLAVTIVVFPNASHAWQLASSDVDAMIVQLDDDSAKKREDAAESLSQTVMPSKLSPVIKKRLEIEKNFHVKLSLYYALASQGEKSALKPLIESLSESGHMGYNYLKYSTGQDFGWNAGQYQEWFETTTDQQFRDLVNERWRRKPMMDEFGEFASLFSKQYFGSMRLVEAGELINPDQQLTDAEKKKLDELPTAKSWRLFQSALNELDDNGDRKAAAKLCETLVTNYPDTFYADQSRDLLAHLKKMIAEDETFKIPDDFAKLPLDEQIDIHVHCLRDARAHQFSQPGSCNLSFHGSADPNSHNYNPATALVEIGDPAAKRLTDILDDRRPIRGVGYWRNFVPQRHVLRYGDAAEQIIREIDTKR